MGDELTRMWQEILARPSGPMAFRFYIQPLVAMTLALRDGLGDARTGRPAYFWALFTNPVHRREWMREGWRAVSKVFLLAMVLDLVYQLTVLGGPRPVQGLVVAVMLAIVPYVLLRGPVNRISRLLFRHQTRHPG